MKYKPSLNLKTKPVIPEAISSLCRFLGSLFKYPPHLPCRWTYNAWDSLGQVLLQPFHGGLLVIRMLSVFGLLVWSILLSSCTGTSVKEPCPPPPTASCPVCESCPTCESSKGTRVPDEKPKVPIYISDLVVKESKIIRGEKSVKCEDATESNSALFLVYEYKITWKFSQRSLSLKGGMTLPLLPSYNPQVTVTGNDDYQATSDRNKLSEVRNYTDSSTPNSDDAAEFRSVKLTLGAICMSDERKSLPDIGRSTTIAKTIAPEPGKFTLTLSIDGQQFSKEFVAK